MRKIAFLVFLVSGGCVGGNEPSVRLLNTVSVRVHESITEFAPYVLEGGETWKFLGLTFVLDDCAPRVIQCATWDMDTAAATTNSAGIAVDCLYLYGLSNKKKVHLFQHEFGHVFGLNHVDGQASVMSTDVNDVTDFTDKDLTEFANIYTAK